MTSIQRVRLHGLEPSRDAVLALPEGPGPHPGVVVIHDMTGFRVDTERHCRRLADVGYVAIAPDLFAGGNPGCVVRTLLSTVTHEGEAYRVIAEARSFIADRDDVDDARLGIIGFCMGGGFALIAAADDRYAVAAPFYGLTPDNASRLRGVCPTLAQYGERDRAFLPHARRLEQHLQELGVEHEVLIHPGVGHSFMNDHHDPLFRVSPHLPPMHAGYDASVESDAWQRVLDFFRRHMPEPQ